MAVKDMTTGNPTKLILWFTLPLLVGNIFQQLYNLADTLIVGRTLGVQSLAAVGATGAIAFLVLGFVMGITSGFTIITAQRFGAHDETGVRRSFTTNIILCIILTLFLTTVSTLTTMPVLKLMNTPQDIIQNAYSYIFIIYLGIGTIIFYNMFSNTMRALGDSKTPLLFLIIASALNVFLDLYFILKLHMGVAGAAWATVISQGISAVMCAIFIRTKFPILKLHKSDWKFDWEFAWQHIRLGFPMGFQLSVLSLGMIAIQIVLNSFGSTTVAAYTAATKVEQVAAQTIVSLGVTMATFAAQNYGAGKLNRIRTGLKDCMFISLIVSVIGGLGIVLFGKQIVSLFVSGHNPQVIEQAKTYLDIIVMFYFALGSLIIFRTTLQGMGNAGIPLLSGLIELVMRTGAAFIFGHYFGYLGVCFATPCAWVSGALILMYGYFTTMRKEVFRSEKHQKSLHFLNLN